MITILKKILGTANGHDKKEGSKKNHTNSFLLPSLYCALPFKTTNL